MMVKYEKPLVSVIIPCYNAEKFVEQAVRSIMEQTYQNLEIICINDCSKDSTGTILRKLAKEDSRIVCVENEENLKLPKTLNKGITLAKGEYIARMDADDISLPERIEKQIKFMLSHNDIDIVGCNSQHIDEYGNIRAYRTYMPIEHRKIAKQMTWKCVLVHPSVLAKKSFFEDVGGFNEQLSYAEDYELWISAIIKSKKMANLQDILLHYRIHSSQMTSNQFNANHAKIIRSFLLQAFKKTYNVLFLFGWLVQTELFYYFINRTASIRQRFKS